MGWAARRLYWLAVAVSGQGVDWAVGSWAVVELVSVSAEVTAVEGSEWESV
jgi:hypothetical protein